mgnify:CR=1 FL=1
MLKHLWLSAALVAITLTAQPGFAQSTESLAIMPLRANQVPAATVEVLDAILAQVLDEVSPHKIITTQDINALLGQQHVDSICGTIARGGQLFEHPQQSRRDLGRAEVTERTVDRLGDDDEFAYAERVVRFMADARRRMAEVIGDEPGTLIAALPSEVFGDVRFEQESPGWVEGLGPDEFQFQAMQGGGYLVQYFVLTGGRIEVALRSGTCQTFNPLSVDKISRDEISTHQERRTDGSGNVC